MILHALAGFVLGALGALAHLGAVRCRASLVRRRGAVAPAVLLYPLGLAGPAVAVLVAARFAVETVWAVPVGMWVARVVVLRRMKEVVA